VNVVDFLLQVELEIFVIDEIAAQVRSARHAPAGTVTERF
jgi:hypothetical protein